MIIKEIIGLDKYGISADGRVWSKRCRNWHKEDGVVIYHELDEWNELSPGKNSTGYLTISSCQMKKKYTYKVHRLVAEYFIGPIPKGMVVNHINHNKMDSRVENLEIITQKENCQKHWEWKKKQKTITITLTNFGIKLTGDEELDRINFFNILKKDIADPAGPSIYAGDKEHVKIVFS
jgi:hypothetical protein